MNRVISWKTGNTEIKVKEGTFRLDIRKKTLEQVTQSCCGCSIIGSVQSQVRWDFEQCDLVNNVPACGGGHGLYNL